MSRIDAIQHGNASPEQKARVDPLHVQPGRGPLGLQVVAASTAAVGGL